MKDGIFSTNQSLEFYPVFFLSNFVESAQESRVELQSLKRRTKGGSTAKSQDLQVVQSGLVFNPFENAGLTEGK